MFGKEKIQKMDISESIYAAIRVVEKALICSARELRFEEREVERELHGLSMNLKAMPIKRYEVPNLGSREERAVKFNCSMRYPWCNWGNNAEVIVKLCKTKDQWDNLASYALVKYADLLGHIYYFKVSNLFTNPAIEHKINSDQTDTINAFEAVA